MSDLQRLLERFAGAGEQRGADAVFDAAVTTVARRRKRRRFRVATATVVALAVAVGGAVVIGRSRNHEQVQVVTTPTSMPTTTVPAAVSASLLASGHWETLPPAPIVARQSPSVVWTGKEMLVWGGASGVRQDILHADGAAYDPRSGTWRRLPAAPLAARQNAATAWTGTEMVIWGGVTNAAGSTTNDGAAYNPTTNRWRKLAAGPLRPQANARAIWSGNRVVIFGQMSSDTAAYDPQTNQWHVLSPPTPPGGAALGWTYALRIDDHRLLAWSHSDTTKQVGPNSTEIRGATIIFLYDGTTNRWQTIPTAPNAVPDIHEAFWTGSQVLVRGDMRDCFICQGPGPLPEVTSSYHPATNTWSPLPNDVVAPGPFGGDNLVSVWTGAALWSFNPNESTSGPVFKLAPGDTSVYDPTARHWTLLKPAPYACTNIAQPIWTGHEVLIYCPSANASGLSYLAPTPRAEPPTPPVITSTGPADPVLINALAAELPPSYHLHSSDSSIDQTGHHFEEAIFTDHLASVARASVFDISPPGASFEQMLSTTPSVTPGGYIPSGTPGVYMQKSNNSRSGVIAKLTGHRALIVSSSISLAHYGTAHPLSTAFLIHAAADLAAKL